MDESVTYVCWECCGTRVESADGPPYCPNCGTLMVEMVEDIITVERVPTEGENEA